jgi:hypothetical protein
MRCFSILKFNSLGRMPKLLLAAGVLALAVAGVGARAKPADAAGPYTIQVTFESIRFSSIDDGFLGGALELYGEVSAQSPRSGQVMRGLGNRNNPAVCESSWFTTGQCSKEVDAGITYPWAQTGLCDFLQGVGCVNPHTFNNNKPTIQVAAGEVITVRANLIDEDPGTDDPACVGIFSRSFTDFELSNMNRSFVLSQTQGQDSGVCVVRINLRRI